VARVVTVADLQRSLTAALFEGRDLV